MKTTRWEIAKHWSENWTNETAKFVTDLGEPSCFACGYYDVKWDNPRVGAEKRWNNSGLERAHIVADKIGGADSPENMLLLCTRCHRQAPMTNDPRIIITWASKRDAHRAMVARAWEHEAAKYNIPHDLDLSGLRAFMDVVDNDGHFLGFNDVDKVSRLAALVDAYARSIQNIGMLDNSIAA
jgi:hypothetical protein